VTSTPDRPLTAQEFLHGHPLYLAFAEMYERLEHPPTSYFQEQEDRGQANLISKAIEKDYIRYLRDWGEEQWINSNSGEITLGNITFPVVIGDHSK
jgi:hypothetical protein